MNKECGAKYCVNKVTITDGVIASMAWQILLAEIKSNGLRFSQSEKDEIQNYIFLGEGLDSRPKLKELAEGCIRKATVRIGRDKRRSG